MELFKENSKPKERVFEKHILRYMFQNLKVFFKKQI
jgi:hypothetical protein